MLETSLTSPTTSIVPQVLLWLASRSVLRSSVLKCSSADFRLNRRSALGQALALWDLTLDNWGFL